MAAHIMTLLSREIWYIAPQRGTLNLQIKRLWRRGGVIMCSEGRKPKLHRNNTVVTMHFSTLLVFSPEFFASTL